MRVWVATNGNIILFLHSIIHGMIMSSQKLPSHVSQNVTALSVCAYQHGCVPSVYQVCMYVCMYACMNAMDVCMYLFMCVCVSCNASNLRWIKSNSCPVTHTTVSPASQPLDTTPPTMSPVVLIWYSTSCLSRPAHHHQLLHLHQWHA